MWVSFLKEVTVAFPDERHRTGQRKLQDDSPNFIFWHCHPRLEHPSDRHALCPEMNCKIKTGPKSPPPSDCEETTHERRVSPSGESMEIMGNWYGESLGKQGSRIAAKFNDDFHL